MNFINRIFDWINILSLIFLIEGFLVITERYTPIYVKDKLQRTNILKLWRNTRFISCIIKAIGFYCFTLSENLLVDDYIKLIITLVGLVLIFLGIFISIRNNITKLGKWSSSI